MIADIRCNIVKLYYDDLNKIIECWSAEGGGGAVNFNLTGAYLVRK